MVTLTCAEAAKKLGVTVGTVHDMCEQKRIAYCKPGGRKIIILEEDLDRYIRDTRIPSAAEETEKAENLLHSINRRIAERT